MTSSCLSKQFPVQISIGNVIEFAFSFEKCSGKVDDGAQVDDYVQGDDPVWWMIVLGSIIQALERARRRYT